MSSPLLDGLAGSPSVSLQMSSTGLIARMCGREIGALTR
jgi:hypothetical protein